MRCEGVVLANEAVSTGLVRLDVELERPSAFRPGQFAMLNVTGPGQLVFSRPFSIFAATDAVSSFLYRIVGRGTEALRALGAGDRVSYLGALGRPFPEPDPTAPAVLIGGGVGLPPVHAWLARHGGPDDLACFGARDGGDAPWGLLDRRWAVSVDDPAGVPGDRVAWHGLVTELAADRLTEATGPRTVLACGPIPLLRAAAHLARERGWACHLSLEEHMGCGYGVCKGCVVPVLSETGDGWRNATCCDEGPVFPADLIAWDRYGVSGLERAD